MSPRSMQLRTTVSQLLMTTGFVMLITNASVSACERVHDTDSPRHCGDVSPRLLALGDDYYDVSAAQRESQETTLAGQISKRELLATLQAQNYSSGQGQRTVCFGSGNNLQPRSWSTTLHEITRKTERASYGENRFRPVQAVILQAREYDQQRRRSPLESVTVPLAAVAIETCAGTLISSQRRKRQLTPTGSYLRETEFTALQTDTALVIQQNVYVNGSLAEWHSWFITP